MRIGTVAVFWYPAFSRSRRSNSETPIARSIEGASGARRRGPTSRRRTRERDGTDGPPSCVGLESHDAVVAVAEQRLVEKVRVLARALIGELLVQPPIRRLERAHAYADEALDLKIELEKIRRDR